MAHGKYNGSFDSLGNVLLGIGGNAIYLFVLAIVPHYFRLFYI